MKQIILLNAFLLVSLFSFAQSDIQIIKIKNADRSVSISAVNNSGIAYTLKVEITLEGMKLESPLQSFYKIFPGTEKHITKLIPIDTRTNFKIRYQAAAIEGGAKISVQKIVPEVTIYTKNEDAKSTQLRQYLIKNEIPFDEVNVSYSDKMRKIYENMLTRRGIKRTEAKFPVILINGEVYYSIDDINKFIGMKF